MFRSSEFLRDHFGNSAQLLAFLRAYGAPTPQQAAAEKWFSRDSVPGSWLPVLLVYLEIENGGPVSLKTYLGGKADAEEQR